MSDGTPPTHARVIAALEKREPDRVPVMDMTMEYKLIYEALGKKVIPLGLLFENPHAAKAIDWLWPRFDHSKIVDVTMDAYTFDKTRAAVALGCDAAWVMHVPIYRYESSKRMHDIFGRRYDVVIDEGHSLGSPMYREGYIHGPADWDAWDKKAIFQLPAKNHRVYSKLQKELGDRIFIFGMFGGGLFELTSQAMGFDHFAVAIRREKEFLRRYIKFYEDLYCTMIEVFADAGLPGVMYTDDLAYRSGPMLNPRTYDELFGDAYRRFTETAHSMGMKIAIHSCGNVYPLLEWFADCGFDGVHALEPTAGVELARAKEMVGDRLCLIGNIDITHVLVDATRDEVFEAVRQAIRNAGVGGGYMVAPTNTHPDMNLERLRWMREAVEEYGRYPLTLDD
jgi:uroporphyrinogen-III decarboxylase